MATLTAANQDTGKTMRSLAITLVLALVAASCATTGASSSWKCSANGLADSSYSGSDYAYVRLQQYSAGGSYKVILNEQKNEARGITKDGTPFTCTKAG